MFIKCEEVDFTDKSINVSNVLKSMLLKIPVENIGMLSDWKFRLTAEMYEDYKSELENKLGVEVSSDLTYMMIPVIRCELMTSSGTPAILGNKEFDTYVSHIEKMNELIISMQESLKSQLRDLEV